MEFNHKPRRSRKSQKNTLPLPPEESRPRAPRASNVVDDDPDDWRLTRMRGRLSPVPLRRRRPDPCAIGNAGNHTRCLLSRSRRGSIAGNRRLATELLLSSSSIAQAIAENSRLPPALTRCSEGMRLGGKRVIRGSFEGAAPPRGFE